MVMKYASFCQFEDRHPLGILQPHLLLPIVHPIHEARELLFRFLLVFWSILFLISQAEKKVALPKIRMHQGLQITHCPLAVGLSVFGDGGLVFPLPIFPYNLLPRGYVITHLGIYRPHPIPSTMAKPFSYSCFRIHHCLSPSFLPIKLQGFSFSVISYNSKQDRPPPEGGRKIKARSYCARKA